MVNILKNMSGTRWYATGEGTNSLAYSINGFTWELINDSNNILNIGLGIKSLYSVTKIYENPDDIRYEINTNTIYNDNLIHKY